MSADKPKPPVSGGPDASPGGVRLTGFKAGPHHDIGIGNVHSFAWEDDEMAVQGEITRSPTGLVISRLEVKVAEGVSAGLTHQLLRRVPLGEILAAARNWRPELQHSYLHMRGGPSASTLPPGRIPITDDVLRQVAVAYLQETVPGKDRAVLQRLADRFERPKGTVRTWLQRAREDGWLGPAVQGRMGAEPGPRLLDDWARQPMVMGTNEQGHIVIAAPPPEGTETPQEARERVRQWLDAQPD